VRNAEWHSFGGLPGKLLWRHKERLNLGILSRFAPNWEDRVVSKSLATKNEPILISFERSDFPGFQNLESLGQENRNKVWRHFQ
jgi:hypothetical protein